MAAAPIIPVKIAERLVGVAGFEPATTRTPSVCATRLRHTPTVIGSARDVRTPEDYTGTADRKTISRRV
jgi:hypothetical protein